MRSAPRGRPRRDARISRWSRPPGRALEERRRRRGTRARGRGVGHVPPPPRCTADARGARPRARATTCRLLRWPSNEATTPRRVTHASESGTALSRWSVARQPRQPPVRINPRRRERRARDGRRRVSYPCPLALPAVVAASGVCRFRVRFQDLFDCHGLSWRRRRRRRLPTQMLLRVARDAVTRAPPRALLVVEPFRRRARAPCPEPCVMPGDGGDGSPSTHGVAGRYTGEVRRRRDPARIGTMVWEQRRLRRRWRRGAVHGEGALVDRHRRRVPRRVARPPARRRREPLRRQVGLRPVGGPFADDRPHGEGVMRMVDGRAEQMSFERGELAGDARNWEHEKAVFFRRLSPRTDDARMRGAAPHGPLDYCYVARAAGWRVDAHRRAKFRGRRRGRRREQRRGRQGAAVLRAGGARSTTPSRARAPTIGARRRGPRRASATRRHEGAAARGDCRAMRARGMRHFTPISSPSLPVRLQRRCRNCKLCLSINGRAAGIRQT